MQGGPFLCSILGFCGETTDCAEIWEALLKTRSRGPDQSRLLYFGKGAMGFNRLSIMGLTEEVCSLRLQKREHDKLPASAGDREGLCAPEKTVEILLVCNGEIYGFRPLKKELEEKGIPLSAIRIVKSCRRCTGNTE